MRTCIGCRVSSAKSDLLRIVAVGADLVPDPRGRMPGRGAHLHPTPDCLALAERRRAFGRALRLTGALDATGVREWLEAQWSTTQQHDTQHTQHTQPTGPSKGRRSR